ncbi:hypothetical protein [Tenacibaculum aiptasiae]|uniref:hypothetical protein n=1 Tax=Tenacibaculum aiptasiae TaxID=426481 RepID=UPI003B58ED9E
MKKTEIRLLVGIGVVILLLDALFMKYWVNSIKPYTNMSVSVEIYRPKIFIVNILIGGVIFYFKRIVSVLFFVNAFVCYFIFSFFWNSWIEEHPYSRQQFLFNSDNKKYSLILEENPNFYAIYQIKPNSKDSLLILYVGENERKGDRVFLKRERKNTNDLMYVYNNELIGFSEKLNSIKLLKITQETQNKEELTLNRNQ